MTPLTFGSLREESEIACTSPKVCVTSLANALFQHSAKQMGAGMRVESKWKARWQANCHRQRHFATKRPKRQRKIAQNFSSVPTTQMREWLVAANDWPTKSKEQTTRRRKERHWNLRAIRPRLRVTRLSKPSGNFLTKRAAKFRAKWMAKRNHDNKKNASLALRFFAALFNSKKMDQKLMGPRALYHGDKKWWQT